MYYNVPPPHALPRPHRLLPRPPTYIVDGGSSSESSPASIRSWALRGDLSQTGDKDKEVDTSSSSSMVIVTLSAESVGTWHYL